MAETIASAMVGIGADLTALNNALAGIPTMLGGVQQKVADAGHDIATKIETTFVDLGPKLTSAGVALSAAISLPIAAAGAAILKFGGDFEFSMTRVQVLSGASADDMKRLTDQAIELGIKTPFSAKQAADARGEFAQAGFKANEIMAAMPGILGLAAAGQVSTAQAALVTSDVLHQFGLEASQASDVATILARTSADSATTIETLGNSFKYIGPVAQAAGVSLTDAAAALMALGDAGIRGEKAGTALVQFMTDLINPTAQAKEALGALEIKLHDATGKMLPLPALVQQFSDAQKNATSDTQFMQQAAQIWGQRMADVLPLIKLGGEALAAKTVQLKEGKLSAEQMGEALMKNLKGSVEQLMGSIETLGIVLYKSFGPTIKDATDEATKFVNKLIEMAKAFSQQPEWIKDTVLALAGFGVVGPASILFLGQFATGLKSILDILPAATDGTTKLAMLLRYGVIGGAAAGGVFVLVEVVKGLKEESEKLGATMDPVFKLVSFLFSLVGEDAKKLSDSKVQLAESTKKVHHECEELSTIFEGRLIPALISGAGPLGALYGAMESLNRLIEQAKDVWGAKTIAMESMDKIAVKVSDTLQSKLNVQMHDAAVKAGGFKDSTALLEAALKAKGIVVDRTGLSTAEYSAKLLEAKARLDSATQATSSHKAELEAAEKAAKQLAAQISAAAESVELFIVRFNQKWNLDDFANAKTASEKLTTALNEIDVELIKLRHKFGTDLPPEVKTLVLHLELAKQSVVSLKTEADRLRTIDFDMDQAFARLAHAIGKVPPELIAIHPVLQDLASEMETKMGDAGIAMEGVGKKGKEAAIEVKSAWSLVLDDLKNAWNNFGGDLADGIMDWLVTGEGSPWTAIKDSFINMLADMGAALIEFGVKYIQGVLIKQLTGLIDDVFPKVQSALAKVFGGAGGAGGAGGPVASDGEDAMGNITNSIGGAVASGISQVLNTVTGVISAVADVIQIFQNEKQEKTLNAIEENTRYAKGYLRDNLVPDAQKYWPKLDNLSELQRLKLIEEVLVYGKDSQWSYLQKISDAMGAGTPAPDVPVDEDGNPINPTVNLDPEVFDTIVQRLNWILDETRYIVTNTARMAELQWLALEAGGGGGGTGGPTEVLVGGGGIGTLNVTVNAETTASADEIAGMVLERILVYVPTGGA